MTTAVTKPRTRNASVDVEIGANGATSGGTLRRVEMEAVAVCSAAGLSAIERFFIQDDAAKAVTSRSALRHLMRT